MLMTEFNINIAKEVWQEEAYEDGVNLVALVRHNQKNGMDLQEAISEAISEAITCDIGTWVMYGFLIEHRSEVENMLLTELNIDIAKEVWQEEAFADGHADKRRTFAEERRMFISVLRAQGMNDEEIAEALGYTLGEIQHF